MRRDDLSRSRSELSLDERRTLVEHLEIHVAELRFEPVRAGRPGRGCFSDAKRLRPSLPVCRTSRRLSRWPTRVGPNAQSTFSTSARARNGPPCCARGRIQRMAMSRRSQPTRTLGTKNCFCPSRFADGANVGALLVAAVAIWAGAWCAIPWLILRSGSRSESDPCGERSPERAWRGCRGISGYDYGRHHTQHSGSHSLLPSLCVLFLTSAPRKDSAIGLILFALTILIFGYWWSRFCATLTQPAS